MDIGVFIPIGNNGWLISTTSPQYMPTFELNKQIVLKAEHYGLDFALSMIKLRGFGGKSEFWDHNLESFTLMAGLAAVTERIQLYATVAVLTIPPAIVARMASTIDSISGGRFGLNVITGWQRPEYSQMGLWPGDEYFARRYEYAAEYVQILRELWATGVSDFKGKFFAMNDCRLSPRPQADMPKIVSIGPGGFMRQGPGDQQAPIPPAPPRRLVPAKPSPEIADKTSLLDLSDRVCRWPMGHPGEPDFHFCGEKVNPGFPYCVEHCGRAYQAQLPRGTRRAPPPLPLAPVWIVSRTRAANALSVGNTPCPVLAIASKNGAALAPSPVIS